MMRRASPIYISVSFLEKDLDFEVNNLRLKQKNVVIRYALVNDMHYLNLSRGSRFSPASSVIGLEVC